MILVPSAELDWNGQNMANPPWLSITLESYRILIFSTGHSRSYSMDDCPITIITVGHVWSSDEFSHCQYLFYRRVWMNSIQNSSLRVNPCWASCDFWDTRGHFWTMAAYMTSTPEPSCSSGLWSQTSMSSDGSTRCLDSLLKTPPSFPGQELKSRCCLNLVTVTSVKQRMSQNYLYTVYIYL